ncbi:tRNA (guanosine(46)-N7)-methyltransferase TrmB [Pelagicoccus enzymogenes]|uniref:tRNA (guanosine(46)-N7)-methyltransferase TrmB n=1 Tax=Pelagicoccus enzymogenes TaxID=2773457 RepID=UPI00280DFC49|nr:tRNA (guanosine(46)-N7)-methyltransferase TrmB [Pelagicoccus enzymogenes]MDQ8198689.1 tRNA (guanosine(46)-N7)-methyltransferase TrmB [Pelagicoccus enzymogenes]
MNTGYEQHLEWVKKRRAELRQKLAKLFPEPADLSLEIGCGHGHWMADFAAAFPEKQCLGVDLIGDRIERAEKKVARAGTSNARFVRGEAFEVLDLMPDHVRLNEVFILFPDPWPKKRHWKNRLFSQKFLSELAKRCRLGVRCYFRTDHDPYFEWAEEVVAEQDLWSREHEFVWPFERETVFQNRAESYQSLVVVKQ